MRKYVIDEIACREMFLAITNDSKYYEQRLKPCIKLLSKYQVKGVYDSSKALKLLQYAVDDYERKNAVEFIGIRLNKLERQQVATELRDYIEDNYKIGGSENE